MTNHITNYGDIIYDKPHNESSIQYKACIAITGAVQRTSRDNLYHELGLGLTIVPQTYIFLTVCSYHVTYAFQSESTLYICLNVTRT